MYSARVVSKALKLLHTHLIAVSWFILNEWLLGNMLKLVTMNMKNGVEF